MLSPEMQQKVSDWRQKAAAGTITLDEMKEAIVLLRSGRRLSAEAAAKSKSKTGGSKKSADEMLNELGSL